MLDSVGAPMMSYRQASRRILRHAQSLDVEWVAPAASLGRTVAAPLPSPTCHPRFASSAMDGFALATHGKEIPPGTLLRVVGRARCGDEPSVAGEEGTWEINTGAPLPRGLDAVVPWEEVEIVEGGGGLATRIRLTVSARPERHVRREGDDFRAGAPILAAGDRVGPAQLMAITALGVERVAVVRVPRASVICTGSELARSSAEAALPGRIRNSSLPYLEGALASLGVEIVSSGTVADDPRCFTELLKHAIDEQADFVVSTGAVSKGSTDFVPEALHSFGARTLLHGVSVRPGKPLFVAQLPGGGIFFGLPGNPAATAVAFRFFVHPYIRAVLGRRAETPMWLPLVGEERKRAGLRYIQRARVESDSGLGVHVRVLPGQEAFRISSLLKANAWAALPEEAEHISSGTRVEVYGLQECDL
ncbi:MAG: molybdopterin molybdotransferase MoeA [Gemmatimonadota bacterium]